MAKKSFEEIRELVAEKFGPLDCVPFEYLNERGRFMHDVYDELDTCFWEATNLEEYVENVRYCISEMLLKPAYYWSPEKVEQSEKVAEKLKRFVRWNIANELWENIPEFQNRKEN